METAPSIMELESGLATNEFEDSDDEEDDDAMDDSPVDTEPAVPHHSGGLDSLATSPAENLIDEDEVAREDQRNVRAKLSHPSSPRSSQPIALPQRPPESPSESKMTVIVKDVAYSTYITLLYYVSRANRYALRSLHLTYLFRYTPTLVFAPLSSSFIQARDHSSVSPMSTPSFAPVEPQGNTMATKKSAIEDFTAATRREWIKEWLRNNPGRPAPCSPKAAYRLADSEFVGLMCLQRVTRATGLDLRELKERAAQVISDALV
jgi:hypothetical protein